MALLPGSPAIGAGSVSLAVDANGVPLQYDQRGPGYPRTTNGAVDIGAYEVQPFLSTPILTVADVGGVYNATPYAATTTVNGGPSLEGVTPTTEYAHYEVATSAWGPLSTTAPTNVGHYEAIGEFAGSTDYLPTTTSSPTYFDITPATASISVINPSNYVYDAQAHGLILGSATGVDDQNLASSVNLGNSFIDVTGGTAQWTFYNPNYVSQSGSAQVAIAPATALVSVTPISGLVYNGAAQETARYSATGVGGVALPSSDFTDTTVHTNAGTYPDTWTFTDQNYVSQTGTVTDVITKVNLKVVAFDTSKVYNGLPSSGFSWAAVGFVNGESLGNTSGNPGFSGSAVGAVNAGSYTITPTVGTLTATNYNFTTFVNGTLTINKANATVTVTPYNVTYNAAAHSATGTATGVKGVLPSSDLTLNTTHTNVGVYSDSWTFTDPNYVSQSGTVTDIINKATATIHVTPYNVTYYVGTQVAH